MARELTKKQKGFTLKELSTLWNEVTALGPIDIKVLPNLTTKDYLGSYKDLCQQQSKKE